MSRPGASGPTSALGEVAGVFAFWNSVVLLLIGCCCSARRPRMTKKPTTVAGRGCSSKSSELSTSPGRAVGYYDDYQQACLPNVVFHDPQNRSSAATPASSKTAHKTADERG